MNTILQTQLDVTTKEEVKKTWAFAVDPRNFARKRRQLTNAADCIITSCSKEAKALGVRVGMHYEDAKMLIPNLRILVIGGHQI